MRSNLRAFRAPGSDRRGSVFVLVVAILAVVALLMITLTYTTRMELWAARNFVDQIQGRVATVTGLPPFDPGLRDPPVIGFGATVADSTISSPLSARSTDSFLPSEDRRVPLNLRVDPRARVVATPHPEATPAVGGTFSGEGPRTALAGRSDSNADSASAPSGPNGGATTGLSGASTTGALTRASADTAAPEWATADQDWTARTVLLQGSFYGNSLGESFVADESAKWNVNAILPAPHQVAPELEGLLAFADAAHPGPASLPGVADFARFIDGALRARGVRAKVAPGELASNIVEWRYGPDGLPGTAHVDDDGNSGQTEPAADGIDNDDDGVIDNVEEETFSPLTNGIDDDRDGRIDEADESILSNGLDDDADGRVDNQEETLDEPGEFRVDVRARPLGDDRPYLSLERLLAVPGMSPDVFEILRPHLTVFSVSQPAFPADKNDLTSGYRQIDPNTASAQEICEALQRRFPHVPVETVAQFAVNVVDRRDPDDVPTTLRLGAEQGEYTGFEIGPRVVEVYPYTGQGNRDGDGDDGQYIEILNPHQRAVDVTGWKVEGVGVMVQLSGSIPAGGRILITDDYNESLDPDPEDDPGVGSLYDIFGVVSLGGSTRLIVEPLLEIPDDAGEVSLHTRENVRVDSMRYVDGLLVGAARKSFQRADPFTRKSVYGRSEAQPGTPGRANIGATEPTRREEEMLKAVESFQNLPFRSPLEILLVTSGASFAGDDSLEDASRGVAGSSDANDSGAEAEREADFGRSDAVSAFSGFRPRSGSETRSANERSDFTSLPALGGAAGASFDLSLVDVFMPGVAPARPTRVFGFDEFDPASKERPSRQSERLRALRDMPRALHGRINLNTASPATMAALPGFDDAFAYRVAWLRYAWLGGVDSTEAPPKALPEGMKTSGAWYEAIPSTETPRWRSLSAFLSDERLWDDVEYVERVERCIPFSLMTTFHSLSASVSTRNVANPTADDRDPTVVASSRIVAGDRGAPETVAFQLGDFSLQPDRDVKYSSPAQADWARHAEFHPLAPVELPRARRASEEDARRQSERMRRLRDDENRERENPGRASMIRAQTSR